MYNQLKFINLMTFKIKKDLPSGNALEMRVVMGEPS